MTSTAPVTSGTLAVPDGTIYYEVRGSGPLLALIGAPMDSGPFAPLAELLAADHTVLCSDPRGHGRSIVHDLDRDSTPELRADDLARVITHVGLGPATVLGSSGGAITGLALAIARPDLVPTLIAHEPPLRELLDDRDEIRAQTEEIVAVYDTGDTLGAIRKFFAMTGLDMPEEVLQQVFGGERDPRSIESDDFFYRHELRTTSGWQPSLEALRATPTRIIIGIGDESGDKFCDRTSRALGRELGIEPTLFPGGHGGFMEQPDAFAKRLREILD
ncbi:alpha/beta fold hydrolase [Nocardia sp. ET3-3]|uniref:Alpha/beta fold hydrolase n=1 Tax=Nocardia terrae TaxID=2675851 RepID=A0A7K1V7W2_9NOCA|nr:alpha/beta hydrolase [Nocardia terrae]MVU82549.1 alpha/beta fold hydrolase [Nocardia terrae]